VLDTVLKYGLLRTSLAPPYCIHANPSSFKGKVWNNDYMAELSKQQHEERPSVAQVRRAELSDIDSLVQLCEQLGYEVEAGEVKNRLSDLLEDPQSDVIVAETDKVAGLATIYYVPTLHEAGPWARITAVVVDENERGAKVGSALVEAAESAAREQGCSRIEATSAFHRENAHRFYKQHGYEQVAAHFLKRL
jgi:N-acetylglutamate synthase-like GNAT family acetyltransferase